MKKTIKYCLALAVACVMLTSCTLWEEEWGECFPPPEVDVPITPDPWEPPKEDGGTVGK